VLGREGVADIVDRCCTLARRMAERLARHESVRVLNDVVLNQVLTQFRPPAGDDAAAADLTQKVIARVQDEGTCWVGGTKWQGQVAMRVSISNWSTTAEDVDRSAAAILTALDGTMASPMSVELRVFVYDWLFAHGLPPTAAEIAEDWGEPSDAFMAQICGFRPPPQLKTTRVPSGDHATSP
jgi:hypothetical protein